MISSGGIGCEDHVMAGFRFQHEGPMRYRASSPLSIDFCDIPLIARTFYHLEDNVEGYYSAKKRYMLKK